MGPIDLKRTIKIQVHVTICIQFAFNLQAQAQKRLQYVELEHQQVRKKDKIRDKAAVLYSELKINEPPEVRM